MAPYFETVRSFADVQWSDSGEIDTASFLEASDGLVKMFDLLGSGVFGFVQSDIRNNIKGVRERFESATEVSITLETLVRESAKNKESYPTACLVRLVRGLSFTCLALQTMQNQPSSELHTCFRHAYDVVLKHHHSFVIRSVVTVAIRAVPRRDVFYEKIAQGGSTTKLDEELKKWLAGLEQLVNHLKEYLEDGEFGQV